MAYFHSASIGDLDCTLITLAPHWGDGGITITPRWSTQIAEGRTGIESRAPDHPDQRHTIRLAYRMRADEAVEFHATLLALKRSDKVAVPLWMDALKPTGADDAFTAQQTINFNPATGEHAINTSGGYPKTCGLLIGCMTRRPILRAVDEGKAIVEITVAEDSPYDCRIEPNELAMSVWDLAPNWANAIEESTTDGVEFDEIGQGREAAVSGQEMYVKRGQRAGFLLNRDEARQLLTFFADRKGALGSFGIPLWHQPGSARSMTARFAKDALSLRWITPNAVTVEIDFVEELPLESGADPQEQAGRTWLYKFQFDGSDAVGFTSYATDLTYDELEYAAQKIEHTSFRQSLRPGDGDDLEIVCDGFEDCPLEPLAKLEYERPLRLTVYECDPADVDNTAEEIFHGDILHAQIKGRTLIGKASTLGGLLRRKVPRFFVQRTNNWTPGEDAFGVDMADHKETGTVSAIDGTAIDVTTTASDAADYFAFGWAVFGTGSTAERRAILRSEPITGGQRLTIHRPIKQTGELAVEFYPGSDGQFSTEASKFPGSRFGGHPRQPAFIEQINTGYKPAIGK